ncbi:MAG: DNA repair protein RecO [Candidatus Porifericomitaceae bacterium WSBS_2022_MAG_OTU9]
MRAGLNECYVLHRRPFRESSLLLEIFSREHGRLPVVHRGVRKLKRGGNAIQPFQLLLLSWSGRGEIATAGRYETVGSAVLAENTAYLCGFYMNELLQHLLHRHEPHPKLFMAYDRCLRAIGSGKDNEQELRYFELTLLNVLGYGPILQQDADGNPLLVGKKYYYSPEQGPLVSENKSACIISGSTMQQLARQGALDKTALQEAKNLMRMLLRHQMQGKWLASQELYKDYLRLGNAAIVSQVQ